MFVDQSLYTLSSEGMVRHYGGRTQDYELATPPDDDDMRPGHDYRFVAEYDDRFYVYDVKWGRVLVFDRATGDYVEQWLTTGRVPPMADLRGMYLVEPSGSRRDESAPPTLVWLSPDGLYQSPLVDDPEGGIIATPAPEASPEASPEPEPTPRRPRRTPRG